MPSHVSHRVVDIDCKIHDDLMDGETGEPPRERPVLLLRAIAPNATAVQGKQGYYVLQSVKPLSLPEATINALRIKRVGGVSDIGLLPAAPAAQ